MESFMMNCWEGEGGVVTFYNYQTMLLLMLHSYLLLHYSKAMRSVKDYACYAKTPEFRVIPGSGNTVITVIIPLR